MKQEHDHLGQSLEDFDTNGRGPLSLVKVLTELLDLFRPILNAGVLPTETRKDLMRQLLDIWIRLLAFGFRRMDGLVGKPFDPELAEIVEVEEEDRVAGVGTVVSVVVPGYSWRGVIVSKAQVRVTYQDSEEEKGE